MLTQNITSSWANIINHFFPIFTKPTANIFSALVNGWILCTARRTVTGMIRFAQLYISKPHDSFHRFFSTAHWSIAELWRILAILLVKTFYRIVRTFSTAPQSPIFILELQYLL